MDVAVIQLDLTLTLGMCQPDERTFMLPLKCSRLLSNPQPITRKKLSDQCSAATHPLSFTRTYFILKMAFYQKTQEGSKLALELQAGREGTGEGHVIPILQHIEHSLPDPQLHCNGHL